MPSDELALLIEKARITVERLRADRDAVRAFDPRLTRGIQNLDVHESEAMYAAAIDAAQRTLDTLVRAAEQLGRSVDAPIEPRADDGS